MLTLEDFKEVSISKIGAAKIIGGVNTYTSYKVTYRYEYNGHYFEDRTYDLGTTGEHELCDVSYDN